MNPGGTEFAKIVTKIVGRAISGPKTVMRSIAIATISTAETLYFLITGGVIEDLGRVKEALLKKVEAEADLAVAEVEAKKKITEAIAAVNEAIRKKRPSQIDRAEAELRWAQAAKTKEEAKAIRRGAETNREKLITEAQTRLVEAIAKLRQNGGAVYVDSDDLKKIIEVS